MLSGNGSRRAQHALFDVYHVALGEGDVFAQEKAVEILISTFIST